MVRKTENSRADTLANDLLRKDVINTAPYFGPRESAWKYLKSKDRKRFGRFEQQYFDSLTHRTVPQRARFIRGYLEDQGFKLFKEASKGTTIQEVVGWLGEDSDWDDWGPGDKFYVVFQDYQIIAVQLGKKNLEKGMNFGSTHIDSPCLMGTGRFKQQNGICYMGAEVYGDFNAANWLSTHLAMHVKAYNRNDKPAEFVIGDKDGEPRFEISDFCAHIDDGKPTSRRQLEVMMGNMPYSRKFDPKKNVLLETIRRFNNGFGLREKDFEGAEIFFYPSEKQCRLNIDYSTISSYGQDDWAGAFPLLYAFSRIRNPAYTIFADFHSKEEIGDEGRGAVSANFLAEILLPAMVELTGDSLGDHYQGSVDGFSIWSDVLGAIHGSTRRELYDEDACFIARGPIINRHSGDEDQDDAWRPSDRVVRIFENFFKKNAIPYQNGTMGPPDDKIPGASKKIHGPLFTEGIDISVPIIGSHRGVGEIVSPIDLWFLSNLFSVFYNLKNHRGFPRRHDAMAEPRRLPARLRSRWH